MSHFTVLVIGDDVDGQLAPFDENLEVEPYVAMTREDAAAKRKEILESEDRYAEEYVEKIRSMTDEQYFQYMAEDYSGHNENGEPLSTYNPKSKWDWYQIGGRWHGMLKIKDEYVKDESAWSKIQLGRPSLLAGPDAAVGWADSAPKFMIDIEGMRNIARDAANKRYDRLEELTHGCETPQSFKQLREQHDDIQKAREVFGNQEWIRAMRKDEDFRLLWGDAVEEFFVNDGGREAYVANAVKNAFSTYAVLKDGEWHSRGDMGWFGVSSNECDDWEEKFAKLIDELPEDTQLTVVDCHI